MAQPNPTEEEFAKMLKGSAAREHGGVVGTHTERALSTPRKRDGVEPKGVEAMKSRHGKSVCTQAGSSPAHAPQAQQFFVPGPLPGQNTFMGKGSRWTYKQAKKEWAKRIGLDIAQAKLKPMRRVQIAWRWQERNKRRDPDNFTGISKKFILDTLVNAGILPDDGWDEIAGWTDHWMVDATSPGVLITLQEVP